MTKRTGLGARLYHNGADLSNDIESIGTIGAPRNTLPATGIDKSAHERMIAHRDGVISAVAFFNPTATHGLLAALPTGDNVVTAAPIGNALGYPAASMAGKQVNYDPTRAADGALTFAVDQVANGSGLDWGEVFGEITDTSATNSASIDAGAASTNGWAAYLHVIAFTGTNCTVTLEGSSDDGAVDTFTSIGAFTAATGVTAERIAGTGALERYVRVATSGTFTSITFVVNFVRYEAAVS